MISYIYSDVSKIKTPQYIHTYMGIWNPIRGEELQLTKEPKTAKIYVCTVAIK